MEAHEDSSRGRLEDPSVGRPRGARAARGALPPRAHGRHRLSARAGGRRDSDRGARGRRRRHVRRAHVRPPVPSSSKRAGGASRSRRRRRTAPRSGGGQRSPEIARRRSFAAGASPPLGRGLTWTGMAHRPKAATSPFQQLDYLYTPSSDVAADARYFTEVLGGRLAFSIEGMGTRVAKVQLTDGPPHILRTDHLEGYRPAFIYRVGDLDAAMRALKKRGWKKKSTLEIPMGPGCSFTLPARHRLALHPLTQPDVATPFARRFDF